ncbi:MAG: hypothetical protein RLZZ501_1656 [Pseudomonadota bacterium]|jgi:molybdopterin synthase catalytic subunit
MIRIQTAPFDPGAELNHLAAGQSEAGALASFVGLVRDEGGRLIALTLEHYPGMAERLLAEIEAEAHRRWSLDAVTILHRVGRMRPGEAIVLVGVLAAHRAEAFAACEFVIDRLKTGAPFWKYEDRSDGAGWVETTAEDAERAQRWE